MNEDDDDPLLFACKACGLNRCEECAHLAVGAFCPHGCWWLWLVDDCKGAM